MCRKIFTLIKYHLIQILNFISFDIRRLCTCQRTKRLFALSDWNSTAHARNQLHLSLSAPRLLPRQSHQRRLSSSSSTNISSKNSSAPVNLGAVAAFPTISSTGISFVLSSFASGKASASVSLSVLSSLQQSHRRGLLSCRRSQVGNHPS